MKFLLSILLLSSFSLFAQNETPELKSSTPKPLGEKNNYQSAKYSQKKSPELNPIGTDDGVINKQEILLLKNKSKAQNTTPKPTLSAQGKREEK